MQTEGVGLKGVLARLVGSLVLVYGTFNPEGYSFFHWALKPLADGQLDVARQAVPIKLLVGLLLTGVWVFFIQTARRSIGWKGAFLVLAIVGVLVWALIDWHLLSPTSSRAIAHLVLIGIAVVLTLGMSWSHLSRRLSGQVDTDEIS
jgi:Family of unknown function (DUF6524)